MMFIISKVVHAYSIYHIQEIKELCLMKCASERNQNMS